MQPSGVLFAGVSYSFDFGGSNMSSPIIKYARNKPSSNACSLKLVTAVSHSLSVTVNLLLRPTSPFTFLVGQLLGMPGLARTKLCDVPLLLPL